MREEIEMHFKCPACGGTKLNAIVESEPEITNLAVFGPGGRPDRDLAFESVEGTWIGYDETGDELVETKYYRCPGCGMKFDTRWAVLCCCTAEDGRNIDEVMGPLNIARSINGVLVPGCSWTLPLKPCEVDDLISANLFDMKDTVDEVMDTIRFLCKGKLYDSDEDAARALGIEPCDVADETCCIMLGSTGRVLVV